MPRRSALATFCAGVAAAALAASAGGAARQAAPPAELFVFERDTVPGHVAETDIILDLSELVPATAAIYVPAGYGLPLGRSPGDVIGTAFAFSERGNVVGAEVDVVDPAFYENDPAVKPCAPQTHAETWVVALKVAEHSWQVPIFVDPTSGADAELGAFRLLACFPSPSLPVEQGGAPEGRESVLLWVRLENVFTNPTAPGLQTWRAIVTPFAPGTATADPGNAFEVRSRVAIPQAIVAKAAYNVRSQTLVVWGRMLSVGKPRPLAEVRLWSRRPIDAVFREIGVAQTRRDGTFSFRISVPQKRAPQELELAAGGSPEEGACTEPALLAAGCISESIAPPPVRYFAATIPKLAPKKKAK